MSDRARNLFVLIFVIALVLVSLVVTVGVPGVVKAQKTHLGLDLQGGIEIVYEARPGATTKVDAASIQNTINIIRSRIDTLGVSEPSITQAGSNLIDVQLPNAKNAAQAQKVIGVTGQLYFYDWEASVIAANGKPAGPNGEGSTGDPTQSSPTSSPGITGTLTEYAAVMRASKQKAASWPLRSSRSPTYFYVNPKKQTVLAGPESASTRALGIGYLQADLAQRKTTLPAGAKLVVVPQGTVVVQATSAPSQPITNAFYVLRDRPFLTGDSISNPQATTDPTNGVVVSFGFKNGGSGTFQSETATLAHRGQQNSFGGVNNLQHFAVTLGGSGSSAPQLVTVPSIDFTQFPNGIPSGNGSEITGGFTFASATSLANVLASGALPLTLKAISSNQVSATLGHHDLNQGLLAGLVGLAVVALFLLLFYRVLGVIAVVALLVYSLYFYALIKLIPVTLTLPGIAGLILTIGVAADANVVIFERVKEEARAGRAPLNAIINGYRRGFAAILDANAVTFMTAFILFILSQADVQGFALTLGIGVLVSLLTAVAATRAILGSMGRTRLIRRPSALGYRESNRRWTFDFMGNSRWFFTLSGTILLVGALAIGGRGINFGIDFVSGSQIQATLKKPASVTQVQAAIGSLHLNTGVPVVQELSSTKKSTHAAATYSFQIRTKTLPNEKLEPISAPGTVGYVLNQRFGLVATSYSFTTVGASFGRTVENSAVIAIIASLLAISVYVAWRFQWKYAVPVLIALAHDLLITAGVYALTGKEVTASTVAALLTILGYSMYDTIIVFDRVRENVQKMQHAAFSQIVNRSMAEVLTRSLATSFCTLLPVVALLIFGGTTLKDFAFALLVGVASGAYSSIFIASPVLTHWKERETVYRRRRARIALENGGFVPAYATTGSAAREEVIERRRSGGRVIAPTLADGTVSPGEFRELVRDIQPETAQTRSVRRPRRTEPRRPPEPPSTPPPAAAPPPLRDPTADALPEDVVMPDQPGTRRPRGGAKPRTNRRKGRPR